MRDSAEMLKEQLRNQGKEMQRREAEQAKNEAKIKHILKVSQEKIEDLQHEVTVSYTHLTLPTICSV